MRRTGIGAGLAAATAAVALAGAAAAQVTVDGSGVRAGGVVIDSRGVHTPGADITGGGVRLGARGVQRGERGRGLTVLRNGVSARMDCRGGPASVVGNGNHLSLEGCSRLEVPGNRNDITVSLVGPAEVSVMGDRNQVRYGTPPGVRPRIHVLGSGARVERQP